MKRWWTHFLIAGYLGALAYGVAAHTIGYQPQAHLGMYFIVWDMYGGWDSFEMRRHLVGEGESGRFYDLAPPWKELVPFGGNQRHHCDYLAVYSGRIAANTLRHTGHEPIIQVLLVEEATPKKYNLPESLWRRYFEEPYEPHSYFYVRGLYDPDTGHCSRRHYTWPQHLAYQALMNNPRLREDVARAQPHIRPETFSGQSAVIQPAAYYLPASRR